MIWWEVNIKDDKLHSRHFNVSYKYKCFNNLLQILFYYTKANKGCSIVLLTILSFWTSFPKKPYLQSQTEKLYITNEFCLLKSQKIRALPFLQKIHFKKIHRGCRRGWSGVEGWSGWSPSLFRVNVFQWKVLISQLA